MDDTLKRIQDALHELESTPVKVAFYGASGTGKSSLINALIGESVAYVGPETDATIEPQFYQWGDHIILGDLPGFGTSRYPVDRFWDKFDLNSFDLFICVQSGKYSADDIRSFSHASNERKPSILVFSRADTIFQYGMTVDQLKEEYRADAKKHVSSEVEIIFTSVKTGEGLDLLELAIQSKLPEAKAEQWIRHARVLSDQIIEEKRRACDSLIALKSGAAALNGINPIPGLDVGIDIGIILKMFEQIRSTFGLGASVEEILKGTVAGAGQAAARKLAEDVIVAATKKGLIALLRRFAGRIATKQVTKYIPILGQALAAGIGYGITYWAGHKYADDCKKLAQLLLSDSIESRR